VPFVSLLRLGSSQHVFGQPFCYVGGWSCTRCRVTEKLCSLTSKTRCAAEDALEFAARALRQYSIGSQDWSRLLDQHKAYAMGKHGKPLQMFKKCAERWPATEACTDLAQTCRPRPCTDSDLPARL